MDNFNTDIFFTDKEEKDYRELINKINNEARPIYPISPMFANPNHLSFTELVLDTRTDVLSALQNLTSDELFDILRYIECGFSIDDLRILTYEALHDKEIMSE